MFAFQSLLTLALTAAVFAVPPTKRADPDCTTQFAGVLSAPVTKNGTTTFKSFTLSPLSQTAYIGDGKSPLVVQFQSCASLNQDKVPGDDSNFGRLFVPGRGKCIAITNQQNAAPPYFTSASGCSLGRSFSGYALAEHTSEFEILMRLVQIGKTDEEGTTPQGGCGVLGYKAEADGTPVITHTNQQITLECDNKHSFSIVTAVA